MTYTKQARRATLANIEKHGLHSQEDVDFMTTEAWKVAGSEVRAAALKAGFITAADIAKYGDENEA